jgi:hypothetical protein
MTGERGREVLVNADPALRQEVEKLLAEDSGDKILDRAATDLLTESVATEITTGSQLGPYRIEAPAPKDPAPLPPPLPKTSTK